MTGAFMGAFGVQVGAKVVVTDLKCLKSR